MADLPKAERELIARARHAFTRLVGLELGDKMTDELLEAHNPPSRGVNNG
jgi:hypothetical protein